MFCHFCLPRLCFSQNILKCLKIYFFLCTFNVFLEIILLDKAIGQKIAENYLEVAGLCISSHDSLTLVTLEGRSSEFMLVPAYVYPYTFNQFFSKVVHYWNPSMRNPMNSCLSVRPDVCNQFFSESVY